MTGFLRRSQLRQRGWTPAMVRDLLGEAHATSPNPVYRSHPPTLLWRESAVLAVEATEEFARRRAQGGKRADIALAVAEQRRQATLARIGAADIQVPVLEWADLCEKAVSHRNFWRSARHWDDFEWATVEDAAPAAVQRWVVNYLRHELTSYESLLYGLVGQIGRVEATDELRRRVYGAIAQAYPELSPECDAQLAERTLAAGVESA